MVGDEFELVETLSDLIDSGAPPRGVDVSCSAEIFFPLSLALSLLGL